MRNARVATSIAELEALQPLWEHLERQPGSTMFQSYAWSMSAARNFSDREQPLVIALETDSGAVIVPAVQTGSRSASFLGEMLFDYRDVLASGDADLVPEALAEVGRRGCDLSLTALRDGCHLMASGIGKATPWVGAPCLRAADITAEAFLAEHFKARKQMRRLRRSGAGFNRYDGGASTLLQWIYERKAEQFAGGAVDIFSDLRRRECMVEIARSVGPRCEVFTIEFGSAIVGALVTFRDGDVRRLYTIWHDVRWEEVSPGIVLLLHACHESLKDGLDVDFLTGEQPHKTRFASGRVQLYRFAADAAGLLTATTPNSMAA